ncbi:MAG TPA: XrtB/PEP-CTERM-associated polysaccharide biosynthesis outer membrane protein EpsL [Usitatibacter sp.]|nr:XrtB/PEP-CTERM-associated polysaccharide biosynthesis outer membrane protein EpsL [Usitatibacter sp.]
MAPSRSGSWRQAAGISGKRLLAIALAAAFSPAASALWGDRLELFADETVTHDSNIFRLSRNVDPRSLGADQRGDWSYSTSLGFNLDVPVSLQRFQLGYTWSDIRYDHFKDLDHHAHVGRAAWLWQVRKELSGDLGYADTQNLATFTNIQATTPDVVKVRQAWFNGAYLVTPSWRVHTALLWGEAEHSDPFRRINDLRAESAEAGLSYVTPQENRVGVAARTERGRNPNHFVVSGTDFNNDYRQNGLGVQGRWVVTGHSRFDGRADYVRREYDQFPQRDYSGPTARATYTWTPTGKTTIATSIYRDIAPLEDIQSSFVLVTGVTVRPQWDVTSKVSVRGDLEYAKWDFHGDPLIGNSFQHRVRTAGVGLIYKPTTKIMLQGSYTHEVRTSTLATGDYKVDTALLEARVGF